MSYVENNLLPNEKVTHWAKLHWIIYLWPIAFFLAAVAVAVGVGAAGIHGGWIASAVLAGNSLLSPAALGGFSELRIRGHEQTRVDQGWGTTIGISSISPSWNPDST